MLFANAWRREVCPFRAAGTLKTQDRKMQHRGCCALDVAWFAACCLPLASCFNDYDVQHGVFLYKFAETHTSKTTIMTPEASARSSPTTLSAVACVPCGHSRFRELRADSRVSVGSYWPLWRYAPCVHDTPSVSITTWHAMLRTSLHVAWRACAYRYTNLKPWFRASLKFFKIILF